VKQNETETEGQKQGDKQKQKQRGWKLGRACEYNGGWQRQGLGWVHSVWFHFAAAVK